MSNDVFASGITEESISAMASQLGVEIPTDGCLRAVFKCACGFVVMQLRDMYKRQHPSPPFVPVEFFGKLRPELRELFGQRSGGSETGVSANEADSDPPEAMKSEAVMNGPTHVTAYKVKAVRKRVKDETYQVLAFAADTLFKFEAVESKDETIVETLQAAQTLVATVTLDREALKTAKPHRLEDQARHRNYWNAETATLCPAMAALTDPNGADLLAYSFLALELRYLLALMGDVPVNVAEFDFANGAHQLHFWSAHTRMVLHWPTKPDGKDMLTKLEAEMAKSTSVFGEDSGAIAV